MARKAANTSRSRSPPRVCKARNRRNVRAPSCCNAVANSVNTSAGIAHGQSCLATKQGEQAISAKCFIFCGYRAAQRRAICPPNDQPQMASGSLNCTANSSTIASSVSGTTLLLWPCPGKSSASTRKCCASGAVTVRHIPPCMPQPCISNNGAPLPLDSTCKLIQCFQQALHICGAVGGRQGDTQTRRACRNGGRTNRAEPDTAFTQRSGQVRRSLIFSD